MPCAFTGLPLLLLLLLLQQVAAEDPTDDPLANLSSVARNVLLLVSLIAFTLVVNNITQKRGVPIPEALCTVMIGIVAGGLTKAFSGFTGTEQIEKLEDESALEFMVAFIAPIIFAEGYGLDFPNFFQNVTRIASHAFLGTLLSSIVVAVGVFYLPPLTGLPAAAQLSFAESLAFGSMISSTDPVTTLAIFKEQHMVENGLDYLYYTVLGESILNDAVALTLFQSFGTLVENNQSITAASIGSITLVFFKTFFVSLAIGVAFGIFTAAILKLARLGEGGSEEEHFYFNVPEIGVALVMSYLPFLVAEAVDMSGIVAAMFAGISMRHYAHYNMTSVTRQVFLPTIELIASLSETYVFLLLGLGVFLLKNNYSASLILWAGAFCLVGRMVHVYPFSFIINRCSRSHGLSLNEQHIVWYAGLRGAIAFMCALSFPQNDLTRIQQHRGYVLCTTVVIVGASLLGLGWPTTSVLKLLDIRNRDDSSADLPRPSGEDGITEEEAGGSRVAEVEGGGDGGNARQVQRSTVYQRVRRGSVDLHDRVKRVLMTSDALMEVQNNNQLLSEMRSQRSSRPSTFAGTMQRPSNFLASSPSQLPRPSNASGPGSMHPVPGSPRGPLLEGQAPAQGPVGVVAGSAVSGDAASAGRPSVPGAFTFGLNPQLGLPLAPGGRPSNASAPGLGRPSAASAPGAAVGRPSAAVSAPGADQAVPLVSGCPSRQQGSWPGRSFRMLVNQ